MLAPEHGPSDDLIFECGCCGARFLSWTAEVGQWRCAYHPGALVAVPVAGRTWYKYTCCGLMPDVVETLGRHAAAAGVSVMAALGGCTARDHAPAYEDIDQPAYFLEWPGRSAGAARVKTSDRAIIASYGDLMPFADAWWTKYATPTQQAAWAMVKKDSSVALASVSRIQTWAPRAASVYDVVEQQEQRLQQHHHYDNPQARALAEEALKRLQRMWTRRLAFGLPPSGAYSAEARARAATLGPTDTSVNAVTELFGVKRHADLPTDAAAQKAYAQCLRLIPGWQ